jgi:hypothetical protein
LLAAFLEIWYSHAGWFAGLAARSILGVDLTKALILRENLRFITALNEENLVVEVD